MAHGGKRTGAGRKAGSKGKYSQHVKDAVLEAFSGLGGVEYLITLGKSDPKTFVTLLNKVIPLQVDASVSHDVSEAFEQLMKAAGGADNA